MAKHEHVTFGVQGQYEFYAPTTGNGQKNRRDRYKCKFYNPETKWCAKIWNKCVGPVKCGKFKYLDKYKCQICE